MICQPEAVPTGALDLLRKILCFIEGMGGPRPKAEFRGARPQVEILECNPRVICGEDLSSLSLRTDWECLLGQVLLLVGAMGMG